MTLKEQKQVYHAFCVAASITDYRLQYLQSVQYKNYVVDYGFPSVDNWFKSTAGRVKLM